MHYFKRFHILIAITLIIILLILVNHYKLLAGSDTDKQNERLDKFWLRALTEVYKSPEELQAQHDRELRKGLLYRKLIKGNPKIKAVALTFDDGPHPVYTMKLLKVLKKYDVKATFFVVGKMAEKHPELVRAEVKNGHMIGNHTYNHVNLTYIPDDEIKVEWQACNDVIKATTGVDMAFCRPPGGQYDSKVINAAMDIGLTTVLWTDDPADYLKPSDKILETNTMEHINPGGIILLHDGIQQTIEILPQIIETLKKKGYKFQTVKEMLRDLNKK
jgi:peptidoglycan/xylan/chitin deacetylase (PgdA/CDA1 family)